MAHKGIRIFTIIFDTIYVIWNVYKSRWAEYTLYLITISTSPHEYVFSLSLYWSTKFKRLPPDQRIWLCYYLRRYLKSEVYINRPNNIYDFKIRITQEISCVIGIYIYIERIHAVGIHWHWLNCLIVIST